MFGPASAQPPRLIVFPVLRLPFVEFVLVGLLVALFFVVIGAVGLFGWIRQILIALPFLCCLPVGLSALIRRGIAFALWKKGKGPQLPE